MKSFHSLRSLFAAAAVLALASPALAAQVGTATYVPGPSLTVSFADLDLAKPADAELLYTRLRVAAHKVCRGELYPFYRECRSTAMNDAVEGIGSPILATVHRAATGRFGRAEMASR
jgi:UrcA family protein